MLDRKYGQEEDRGLDRMLKIATAIDQKRHSDLRYESARFNLEQAKRKSQEDREAYSKLGGFMGTLTGVLDDEESSLTDKQIQLAEVSMQFPMLVTNNPVASTLLRGASNILQAKSRGLNAQLKAEEDARTGGIAQDEKQQGALGKMLDDVRKIRPTSATKQLDEWSAQNEGGVLPPKFQPRWEDEDKVMLDYYAERVGIPRDKINKLSPDRLRVEIMKAATKSKLNEDRALGEAHTRRPRLKQGTL